jgi:hypothetical protein
LRKYHIIRSFIVAVQNYRQKKYYQWAGEADEFQSVNLVFSTAFY